MPAAYFEDPRSAGEYVKRLHRPPNPHLGWPSTLEVYQVLPGLEQDEGEGSSGEEEEPIGAVPIRPVKSAYVDT
jgi:hypothetical protein